jgi:hypothetical protein
MTTLLIIVSVLFGAVLVGFLYHTVQLNSRKSEFKDWIVGDKLILKTNSSMYAAMQKLNQDLVDVVGWNENNIYLKIGDNTHQCEWSCFDANKSAIWRRNYEECKQSMGVEPGFNANLIESKSGGKIHGKPIELLTEVECEVFLKISIEEEDYDTAELIKKRMEKFR